MNTEHTATKDLLGINLKSVSIKELFSTFTHNIQIKKEGITLILGQNGLGKTAVLKIIQAVFNKDILYLSDIEYESINIDFENNISWIIEKVEQESGTEVLLKLIRNNIVEDSVSFKEINQKNERLALTLKRHLPISFRRIDEDEWLNRADNTKYTTKELIAEYKHLLPSSLITKYTALPEWYSTVVDNQNVMLIETQRLLTLLKPDEHNRYGSTSTYKNTVDEYSKDLSKEINISLANASELSTKLDSTYPNRLISRLKKTSNISLLDLNEKLLALETKRLKLQEVGLLDLENQPNILSIEKQDKAINEVLLVYIEDSHKKLEIYDDISKRIGLFLQIINEHFLIKRLSISKEEGFHFESLRTGKPIPVKSLSSGEQHIIVLFYQLLFKLKRNTLLLIDEPEISLHISWQKRFIKSLKSVLHLNPMNVLIATHSPAIIGNNWDLTVELDAEEHELTK